MVNKALNDEGAEGYRKATLKKMEIPSDIMFEEFPKQTENEDKVSEASRDLTPDEFTGGLDRVADESADAEHEIEHLPESHKHSSEHEPIDENAIKKGLGLKDVKSGSGTN
jgi:hypothetical protein